MAKNKTIETTESVENYILRIENTKRREDCQALVKLFEVATGLSAKMWGTAIIGFGSYHYKYASGHEGDAPLAGLSVRAKAITLYLADEYEGREELMAKLGKHKSGKACVYIDNLENIETSILKEMIIRSVAHIRQQYPD